MDDYAVTINSLDYSYNNDETYALKNINLKILENDFIGIIGENGAGKSTLLKTITGLLKPGSGTIVVLGADTNEVSVAKLATKVGFLMQNPDRQLFSSTVYGEVAFGPLSLGITTNEIKKRVEYALDAVGISALRDYFPPELSRSDRAKVVLASILAMKPKILVLDEPTSGQDYMGSYQIMNIARELHGQGITVIIATHQMALVAEYVQRVIVMGKGKIIMQGTAKEVFSNPKKLKESSITLPQITNLGFRVREMLGADKVFLNIDEMRDAVVNFLQKKQ